MKATVDVESVKAIETQSGNTRYVLRDSEGNEYTTFRPQIGASAREIEGRRAEIEFHEEQRGRYTNVYLDAVKPAEDQSPAQGQREGATDPEEAAWRTAVDAAPWLVGTSEPHEEVPPDELFEKLKPFKERVSEDIVEHEERD